MPRASSRKTAARKASKTEEVASEVECVKFGELDNISKKRSFLSRKVTVVVIIIGALALVYFNKSSIIAASVNGQLIPAWEVNQKLNSIYRQQVLNQIINEKIIEQEAAKKRVVVSSQQVQQKVEEAEKQYGGKEAFGSLLSLQGINKDDFVRQTRLTLLVEQMYKDEIKPTDEEVKKFMDENADIPEATEPAKFKTVAEGSIKQQKLTKTFGEKFPELRNAVKIQIF